MEWIPIKKKTKESTITNAELSIDGNTIERKDRENGVLGGVLCYIRSDVNYIRRVVLENKDLEAIWIEILVKKSRSILSFIIYRPPDSSK